MKATDAAYDVIIVGAGSAGSVLAARLSENPDRRVLLLEAGPDYRTLADFPAEIARASSRAANVPGHPNNWNFQGELSAGRPYPLVRGKIVGGSSAINGTYFIRGCPSDFDQWAALGNDLWSYDQVLPFFNKSEHDLDFDGEFHGHDGPMPVQRSRPDEMHPVSRAFTEACLRAGFAGDADKNAPDDQSGGVGPIPFNVRDGIRMNTAMTYLAPARSRPNLSVHGRTFVRQVLFEGTRAVGVEAAHGGRLVRFHADQVVLSAGSIKSAHLLMLSGVGPADELANHGVRVVHDSPGVGRNIKDHPSLRASFTVRAPSASQPEDLRTGPGQTCLNFTAPGSSDISDLQIICGASQQSHSFLCGLELGKSTGEISLRSGDPDVQPAISLNYLSDPADLPRVADCVRMSVELLFSPEFKRLGAKRISPGDEHVASDDALKTWIADHLATSAHTVSSARMGLATDSTAVVDQHCRVHGVDALRVADASIMPTLVRRGPAATAVMIGERAAALFAMTM